MKCIVTVQILYNKRLVFSQLCKVWFLALFFQQHLVFAWRLVLKDIILLSNHLAAFKDTSIQCPQDSFPSHGLIENGYLFGGKIKQQVTSQDLSQTAICKNYAILL